MNQSTLKQLQQTELEMLEIFDCFCKANNLKYSLFAGTALGAVRHNGFIPWDDDIDVCMTRTEYERFLQLWKRQPIEGYFLQASDDINSKINHSKIRKDNTSITEKFVFTDKGHQGIFIDIFPMDFVPKSKLKKSYLLFLAKVRIFYSRGVKYDAGNRFTRLLSTVLLFPPEKLQRLIKDKCEKKILNSSSTPENCYLMCLNSLDGLVIEWPFDILDELCKIRFENKMFDISANYDQMLQIHFGDYMKLPPEEEQVCKHSVDIEFETDNYIIT